MNVVNFDYKHLQWLKKFKICNHGYKQKCTFDYNLGLHAKFLNNNNNMGHVRSQY